MKKIVILTISLLVLFILTACNDTIIEEPILNTSNQNTLGILSYVSTAFLDGVNEVNSDVSNGMTAQSVDKKDENTTTSIEDRIDLVNMYFDKLKSFVDPGENDLVSVEEFESDKPEYETLVKILVDGNEYLFYYNEDMDTQDVTGILVFNDVEYNILTENSEIDEKYNEDESEIKFTIKLMARRDADSIIIEYVAKEDGDGFKHYFSIISTINNTIDELEIEVKRDASENVLTITENENEYKFKFDGDEENFSAYKLDYIVEGVKGKVRIIETSNDLGETIYLYRIQERNVKVDIEIEDPDN